MCTTPQDEVPQLIPSKEDSSLYSVLYKGHYLYSKYNPKKALVRLISSQTILQGTLILVNAPLLFYGLTELKAHCPQNCPIFALEAEPALYALSKEALHSSPQDEVRLFSLADLRTIDAALRNLVHTGTIKRVLSIDFSQGKEFAPALYKKIADAAQEIIALFWKNRITLSKLGKLFSKNIFQNLQNLTTENQLDSVLHSVRKPILVCGAGESLDKTLKDTSIVNAIQHKRIYLLAVDAALSPLQERGIRADAIVSLEAQFAIEKAFLGAKNSSATLFADLSCRPQTARLFKNTIWFCSEYDDARYLHYLQEQGIIRALIPPLGSVGLCAVYLALQLRAHTELPIFVSGLDFAFSKAHTHAKNVLQEKDRLIETTRTKPLGSYGAAFSLQSSPIKTQSGNSMYTIPNLQQYANSFYALFSTEKNIFTLSDGIPLGVPPAPPSFFENLPALPIKIQNAKGTEEHKAPHIASDFYRAEKNALCILKDLLIQGNNSSFYQKDTSLTEQIKSLFLPRDYLYLHFPDGYAPSTEPYFLKRVRAEIDFFLKQITIASSL